MSKNLTPLQTQLAAHEVFGQFRYIVIDGEIYFVAIDVCKILGIKNHRDALAKQLDDDEKDYVDITDAIGRNRKTLVVNESGLYSLVFMSRKPAAKKFRKWVTSEVLPGIRKTGSYSAVKIPVPQDNQDNFDEIAPALKEYFKKNPNADFDIVGASIVQGDDGLPALRLHIGLVED